MLCYVVLLVLSLFSVTKLAASDFSCAGFSITFPPYTTAGKAAYSSPRPIGPNGVHALVIFAQFHSDNPHTQSIPAYARDLFDRELPGSLAHFYDAMSFGAFELQGTVFPRRYNSAKTASAYLSTKAGEKGQYGRFVEEILLQVDEEIDFGQFDNDGPDGLPNSGDDDGWVDYLFVNVRSTPRGFIKGGATGIVGLGLSSPFISQDAGAGGDNIRISGNIPKGCFGKDGTFSQTVGTMAHEFGHSLRLPDLYDLHYEDPATDSAGIGKWGLMGWGAHGWNGNDGPNPFSAWSLKQLGWITPENDRLTEVTEDTVDLPIASLHAGGRAYRIPLRMPGGEYLLLERRTRASSYYDRHLPGEGVLIWHIRPGASNNNHEDFKLVDLVCADGLFRDVGFPQGKREDGKFGGDNLDFWAHDLTYNGNHSGNMGDATDLFDGRHFANFGPGANPSSDPQGLLPGASTGLEIGIRRQQEDLRIDVIQPRWSGVIDSEVHWGESVLVGGDLTVAPEGELMVHSDTRIHIAGTDRLRGGRDPERCELLIQGNFIISRPSYMEPDAQVIFQAQNPGENWYGILFEPMAWLGNQLPPDSDFELRDAEHGIGLLTEDWPVLLVLGEPYDEVQQDALRRICNGVLDDLGLKAAVVELKDAKKGAVFDALLSRYLDREQLVLWLGGSRDRAAQNALLNFLEDGGRLFLATHQLPSWHGEMHITSQISSVLEISSAGMLADSTMNFKTRCRRLGIIAPAIPMLLDERHGVSGLRLETEDRHLAYLPFDLQKIEPEMAGRLLEAILPSLRGEFASGAVLETPDHQIKENKTQVLMRPDESILVRAPIEGDYEKVELVAHAMHEKKRVPGIPMRKVGAGLYEAEFKAPDSDEYLLWLRLQNREGGVVYSAQSLQLMAVLFTEEHPILVFMGGSYLPSRREAFLSDLGTVLQPLGLEANILKIVPEKGFPYQAFLKHYIEPGKVAIWLGHSLDEEGQAAFGEFLDLGGQLLMSSFSLRTSPGINTFLRECLGISQIGNSERGQFPGASTALVQDFSMLYRPLTLVDPALPSVVDKEGRVAGLRLDEEISRVTFLSFDLFNMEAYTRRELLQTELIFLLAPRLGRVNLQVQAVRAPDRLMPLERIVPEIIVANTGGEPSGPFSVGYQILQGEEVLFSAERDIASLEGGIARVVQLPAWMPVGAEDFQIRFGVGTPDENRLAYSPARPLHVVEGVAPFDELILPGAVSSGNGAGFFDYDNDGDSDLYLVRRNAANQLFRNDGTEFSEQAEEAGIADDGLGRGLALGDYDGDGDLDLYLVNEGANRFLFNDGDGRFSEGIERLSVHPGEQRKLANDASGRSAGFFDYDGDGDLDLYLVNATGVNCLFENTAGQFSEVATTAGLADAGNGRGLAFGDYDGDGDIDLFVANQTGGSHFFRNDRGTFRDVNRHLGLEFAGGEVGAVFGDYDDDGDLDLFLSSETGPSYLNRNEGGFSFERVVGKDSLYLGSQTVGAAFLDYDNDGDLDLATTALRAEAGGDALYQNRGDGMFISVGELLQLRTESSGRGLSFSDYDGDGDLDLFIADSRRSHFYRNTADPTHWLQVELEGPPVNRQGLGASVELVAGGRPQYRELQSAFGYGSQVQPGVHFGLGTAVQADTLRVRWPDGLQTIQFGLRAGQRLLLFHPRLSTAVTEAEGRDLGRFRLFSNVPNPFNAGTIIHFELPRSGEMELAVFNVLGQPVRGLINGVLDAGVYQVAWNGRDEGGRNLGSGVYFCRLAGDGRVQTRRMLLLK